jgi:hypothetical protein
MVLVSICKLIAVVDSALFPEFFSVMEKYSSPEEVFTKLVFSIVMTPWTVATLDAEFATPYTLTPDATAIPIRIKVVIAGEIARLFLMIGVIEN